MITGRAAIAFGEIGKLKKNHFARNKSNDSFLKEGLPCPPSIKFFDAAGRFTNWVLSDFFSCYRCTPPQLVDGVWISEVVAQDFPRGSGVILDARRTPFTISVNNAREIGVLSNESVTSATSRVGWDYRLGIVKLPIGDGAIIKLPIGDGQDTGVEYFFFAGFSNISSLSDYRVSENQYCATRQKSRKPGYQLRYYLLSSIRGMVLLV